MTSTRTPFAVTLGVCTAVSLAGNVGAATLLPHHLALPTPAVIAAASVAPLLLPAAVHLVPRAAGLPKGARGVVVFAVIVASIAAFAMSFASLMAVAQASGHPGLLGALLPLAVDVLAGAAAYALVVMPAAATAAERAPEQLAAAAEQAPEQTVHQPVQTPVHQPVQPTVEQPVHQHAVTAPEPVVQAGAPVVTRDDEVVHRPGASVHQEVETEAVHAIERPRLVPVHRADAPAQTGPEQSPERVVHQHTEPAPVQSPVVVQALHRTQAAVVVQAGGIELAVEKVAEIYARKDAGQSQNEIANAKVAAKRTVAKVLARRDELLTAEEPAPALA